MTTAPKLCRAPMAAIAAAMVMVISVLGLAGCGRKSGLEAPPIAAAPEQRAPAPQPDSEPANPPQR
ncbi:MAG: lipoprotein [Xanthobacteraceae bacterium]